MRPAVLSGVRYGAVTASSIALSVLGWSAPGTEDVADIWLPWMDAVARHGLIKGYAEIGADYPPGAAALLLAARRLLPAAADLTVVKALLAAAQLVSTLLFAVFCRRTGPSLCFVAAVALSASTLGYLDMLFAAPLVVALFAALDKRPALSATAFTIACVVKWQPLILLPFLLPLWIEQARKVSIGHVVLAAGPSLAICAAIAWWFWPEIWLAFGEAFAHGTWSAYALNLPWLLQVAVGLSPQVTDAPDHAILALRLLFAAIYLPLVVRALSRRGSAEDALTYGLAGFATYFMLAPSVHENHLFTATVLAFVLWARDRSMAWPAIGIALFANLNLVVFYGLAGAVLFSPGPRFALLTGALSAVATAAYCYGLYRLIAGSPARDSPTGSAGGPSAIAAGNR
jgi:hypothetical protein